MKKLYLLLLLTLLSFKSLPTYTYSIIIEGVDSIEVLKSITDDKIRPIFNSVGIFDYKSNILVIESENEISKELFESKTGLKTIKFEVQ